MFTDFHWQPNLLAIQKGLMAQPIRKTLGGLSKNSNFVQNQGFPEKIPPQLNRWSHCEIGFTFHLVNI